MTVIDIFSAALAMVMAAFLVLGTGLSLWQIHEEYDSLAGELT